MAENTNVTIAVRSALYQAVNWAVFSVVYWAVRRAVAVYWIVDESVRDAVDRAVDGAVYDALEQEPACSVLPDFLLEVGAEV
jgi:hypothetical protein